MHIHVSHFWTQFPREAVQEHQLATRTSMDRTFGSGAHRNTGKCPLAKMSWLSNDFGAPCFETWHHVLVICWMTGLLDDWFVGWLIPHRDCRGKTPPFGEHGIFQLSTSPSLQCFHDQTPRTQTYRSTNGVLLQNLKWKELQSLHLYLYSFQVKKN